MSNVSMLSMLFGALVTSIVWVFATRFKLYRMERHDKVSMEMNAAVWAFLRHKGIATDSEVHVFVSTAIDKAFEEK